MPLLMPEKECLLCNARIERVEHRNRNWDWQAEVMREEVHSVEHRIKAVFRLLSDLLSG